MSNLNPTREETDAFAPVSISIIKKKRSLPGHPDPDAEVIALSPRSLLATNRFVCEICLKGYQRDQNLQLHRRGHNLPWRLKQKASHEVKKKVYVCPESTCVHHDPARALGDLTGIKKHFSRKHGEKKWKCDKCSKRYAVQSDWKAHQKTCGTREYRCDCGTLFSRKDSFITHRAFCEALAEENGKGVPHRQWENQQSAACLDNKGHNGSLGEDRSAAMEAASSPISQLTGDALTSSEVSKPISAKISSDFTLPECGIASLSSKWIQGGIGANSASLSKGPGLSLCLGTGPGPGPPSALQMMGSQTPSGSGPPFIMPSLKGLNKLGFSRMPGSESHDTSKHVSSSTGAMDMLANLFSSSENGRSWHDGSNGMAGVSGYTRLLNHDDQLTIPSFAMLPAGSSTSISSMMMNDFGSPNGRSKTSLQRTASAPMSATALLQKAAQMGATASNPSLLQKFGMRVGESSSSTAAGGVQRHASWAGVSSIISSSMPAYSTMRQAEDLRSGGSDCRAGGLVFPSASGHGSMQGFMNSISGGAGLFGSALHDMASAVGPSTNGNNFLKHADMLRDKELSNTLNGRPSFGDRVALQPGHGGPPRSGGDTQMLDFLGVGCPSGTVAGTSAGIGQILSHRDLATITALNAGIKVENSMYYQDDNRGARQLYPS